MKYYLETFLSLVIKLHFTPQIERYTKEKKSIYPYKIWNRKCLLFWYLFTLHIFNSKNGKTNIRTKNETKYEMYKSSRTVDLANNFDFACSVRGKASRSVASSRLQHPDLRSHQNLLPVLQSFICLSHQPPTKTDASSFDTPHQHILNLQNLSFMTNPC